MTADRTWNRNPAPPSLPYPIRSTTTPPMMMPKQKPVNPAPPMAPSCAPVNPKSAAQLARMPPRMPNPMPAARMARNPAHSRRLAFDAIGSLLTDRLVMALLARDSGVWAGLVYSGSGGSACPVPDRVPHYNGAGWRPPHAPVRDKTP